MSKLVRIVLVIACMAVVVGVGMQGVAWADKLKGGENEAVASVAGQSAQAKPRPKGTVPTKPICITTRVAGEFIVGSIAQWSLDTVVEGKQYVACVVKQIDLPAKKPGPLLTSPIELIVNTDPTMNVPHKVCFPLPPNKDGYVFYWDGLTATWIQSTEPPTADGMACVTVPATVVSPTYVVFSKKP